MATPLGTAAVARQAASGYALSALPRNERLTPLPGTSTNFTQAVIERAGNRAQEIVQQALDRKQGGTTKDGYAIFHLDMPYRLGVTEITAIADGHFLLFPTHIVSGKRVSAVAIRSTQPSKEAAKATALRDISLLAALLTLAKGLHYELAYPEWPHRQRRIDFIATIDEVEHKKHYPRGSTVVPADEIDPDFIERASWIWAAAHDLGADDLKTFKTALFAFYAGRAQSRDSSTLSIVANIAALNKLAEDKKCVCAGIVSCATCGVLPNFSHNLVGDAAAITAFIAETMELSPEDAKAVKKLIRRVYGDQRSAFVHSAELRHHEYRQGGQLHFGLPSLTGNAQEVALYQTDLQSIMRITRRTLLTWLAKKSDRPMRRELCGLDEGSLVGQLRPSAMIGLQPRIMAVLQTD